MEDLIKQYKIPLIGGLIGLILAILLVSLGFFKTILILLLTIVGAYLALYMDKNNLIPNFLKRNH